MRTHNESIAAASRLDTSKGVCSDSHPNLVLRKGDFACLSMPRFWLRCGMLLGSSFHDCSAKFLSLSGASVKSTAESLPEGFLWGFGIAPYLLAKRLVLAFSLGAVPDE